MMDIIINIFAVIGLLCVLTVMYYLILALVIYKFKPKSKPTENLKWCEEIEQHQIP